jgi:hypothetical protein
LKFLLVRKTIVAIQPTFMLIADIAGYTRFVKSHRASLAHAQEIVAQLLEAVIDARSPPLTLAKLEGDAAFVYVKFPQVGARPRIRGRTGSRYLSPVPRTPFRPHDQ